MENKNKITIYESTTINDALKVIDKGSLRVAIVVNNNSKVIGVLNDGDVRRAIIKGYDLNNSIKNIYQKKPIIAYKNESKDLILAKAINNNIYQIPILDENNELFDIINLTSLLNTKRKVNKVIIMAGGLGTRLHPLTKSKPKPLLSVGNKPILQTIVENFVSQGFKNIIISLNYKSEMIKEYFKDGKEFGASITYIEEHKRLGTAGALSLLEDEPNKPFFVMNGDLLTNVDFVSLVEFHNSSNASATMCVREFNYQIPYGVIQTENEHIVSINEKPINKFFVNAGIYLLSPKVLSHIPKNEFYDMPTLFEKLINEKETTLSFPIHEYWIDIGQHQDFKKANEEYYDNF